MSLETTGIFGSFSYREFKYNNTYFGLDPNNTTSEQQCSNLSSKFVKGQRLFQSLSNVDISEFTDHYYSFLTFLKINQFNNDDFISYILPKNIRSCLGLCFLRKKNNKGDIINAQIVYNHLSTLTITSVASANNNVIINLRSSICDDQFTFYVRYDSNQIELLDDLLIFYQVPKELEINKIYKIGEIEYMMNNNLINLLFLYDTTKLFPRDSDGKVIKEINKILEIRENKEKIYIKNLEYRLNFSSPIQIYKSKSFFITSFTELWNVSYPRKIKKYLILNINKFDRVKEDYKSILHLEVKNKIDDMQYIRKINNYSQEIINVIYLLQSDDFI